MYEVHLLCPLFEFQEYRISFERILKNDVQLPRKQKKKTYFWRMGGE